MTIKYAIPGNLSSFGWSGSDSLPQWNWDIPYWHNCMISLHYELKTLFVCNKICIASSPVFSDPETGLSVMHECQKCAIQRTHLQANVFVSRHRNQGGVIFKTAYRFDVLMEIIFWQFVLHVTDQSNFCLSFLFRGYTSAPLADTKYEVSNSVSASPCTIHHGNVLSLAIIHLRSWVASSCVQRG